MRECCKNWLRNCKPLIPSSGQFSETHLCPTCKNAQKITFEEIPSVTVKGKSEYALIDPWSQECTQEFE